MSQAGQIVKLTALMFCLTSPVFYAPSLNAQTPQKWPPEPEREANWLLATCNGMEIPGSAQPDKISLATCVKKNGLNKIESVFLMTEIGLSPCRLGVDNCPDLKNEYLRIKEEFNCKNGLKNGPYKGNIRHNVRSHKIFGARVEANYVNGKLEGESRHFSYSGATLCYRYQYKNGLLNGKAEKILADGKVAQDAYFKNGLRNGKTTTFEKNGKIVTFATYKNGFLDGDTVYFNNQGIGQQIYTYEMGVEVKRTTTENGKTVVLNSSQPTEMKKREINISSSKPNRRFYPFIALNLGYLNDDLNDEESKKQNDNRVSGFTIGPQLTLPFVTCRDAACGGYVLNLGTARSPVTDKPFYHGEVGLGVLAMWFSGYLGAGMRVDGERKAVQATFFTGATLVNFYMRGFAYTDKDRGGGFETGLMLSYPLFGF